MIKNARQLTVTLQQRERLAQALAALEGANGSDLLERARIGALEGDIGKLDAQIAQYRRAVSGGVNFAAIAGVATVGEDLVTARIAAGLTQEELAARVGSKAQQIQRYERDRYLQASLKTLMKIAAAIAAGRREREEAQIAQ